MIECFSGIGGTINVGNNCTKLSRNDLNSLYLRLTTILFCNSCDCSWIVYTIIDELINRSELMTSMVKSEASSS